MIIDIERRLNNIGGWGSFAVGLGFVGYVGYALAVGRVIVASRSTGETTIQLSAGWPFILGLALYFAGALVFLWIAWRLLKSPGT